MVKYRLPNLDGSKMQSLIRSSSVTLFALVFAFGCAEETPEPALELEVGVEAVDAINPCDGRSLDDSCITRSGEGGLCIDDGRGGLTCTVVDPCFDSVEGEGCVTQWQSPGVCINFYAGNLYCEPSGSCVAQTENSSCTAEFGDPGVCASAGEGGLLYCRLPGPCDGKGRGEPCATSTGANGQCVDVSGFDPDADLKAPSINLYCEEIEL